MDEVLEAVAREGAQRMLQRALEAEVDDFLPRERYQRSVEWRGYRNGYLAKQRSASAWAPSRFGAHG